MTYVRCSHSDQVWCTHPYCKDRSMNLCPECKNNKHPNCDHKAYNEELDDFVDCDCECNDR